MNCNRPTAWICHLTNRRRGRRPFGAFVPSGPGREARPLLRRSELGWRKAQRLSLSSKAATGLAVCAGPAHTCAFSESARRYGNSLRKKAGRRRPALRVPSLLLLLQPASQPQRPAAPSRRRARRRAPRSALGACSRPRPRQASPSPPGGASGVRARARGPFLSPASPLPSPRAPPPFPSPFPRGAPRPVSC